MCPVSVAQQITIPFLYSIHRLVFWWKQCSLWGTVWNLIYIEQIRDLWWTMWYWDMFLRVFRFFSSRFHLSTALIFPRFITAVIIRRSVRRLGTLKQSNAFSNIWGRIWKKIPAYCFPGLQSVKQSIPYTICQRSFGFSPSWRPYQFLHCS
jgi:hypothetical protein